MTDLLNSNYIIDGVQMALSPERMLREISVDPPLEPDGDPETLADEQLDQKPDNYVFDEGKVKQYAAALTPPLKRGVPLPFSGPFTAGKVAQALLDAIWMAGHFRLGDLSLKADWKWNCKAMGHAAAFYLSVERACSYLDSLGLKLDRYSLCSGQPTVSFKPCTLSGDDFLDEEASLFRDPPYRTIHPRMSRKRKTPSTLLPEPSDWLIYIPFDPCDFRLGGSALAETLGAHPSTAPDVNDAEYFADCYEVVRELVEDGVVKAGATVGDGGLMTCLRSLTSAGTGATVSIRNICKAYGEQASVRVLFGEVPGVVLQIADIDYDYIDAEFILQDVVYYPIGHPDTSHKGVQLTEAIEIPQILESLLNTMEGED